MGDTAISWTDKVWNPLTGCTRVSAGCNNCYAFQLHDIRHVAWKRGRMPNAAPQYHQPFSRVQLFPERLTQPLHWRKPARIFVNSMSDLFHEDVPFAFVDQVWAVMALTPRHTYQILTKRPERMLRYLQRGCLYDGVLDAADALRATRPGLTSIGISNPAKFPLPNVHLGTSVEDQDAADERLPHLLRTPAAVRFLSVEPMLGPLNIWRYLWFTGPSTAGPWTDWSGARRGGGGIGGSAMSYRRSGDVGWVIAGGESGPHARPVDLDWVRNLRDACIGAKVPFYFKQIGGRTPKAGGRELDGRTWDEFPSSGSVAVEA